VVWEQPGGLVFKAQRFLYHSTLGLRVMKKKNNNNLEVCAQSISNNVARVLQEGNPLEL